MTSKLLAAAALLAWSASGCGESVSAAAPPAQAPAPATRSAESAAATAGELDTRVAVPLLPMMAQHQKAQMRDHLGAVQAIVAALAHDDFAAIEKAARQIGYSDAMAKMCTHMGAGAPGFTPTAVHFHRTADTIGAAARKHDRAAVLDALGATLTTCVGCHATFKQQVVDEATWSRSTSTAPPAADHAACPMMAH